MENFYLILVVILFALAISDLIVGVSNDAVNFLNSAIGSKAARKWVIYTVASLGVLVGATFSSGMMEVARKGIFHPDMFVFSEIMVIFLAVMITDIILLDTFNTFGLPTSTTVSIVFELLGAAVAVSLVKIYSSDGSLVELAKYINSGKALAIITGILLSVFVAFVVGAIIQYLSRLMFSFRYQKNLKYFAGFFGGLAIASITYFMIIKGAKGASFMKAETVAFLKNNMLEILIYSLIGWTILLQLLYWLFKIDIPKIIVLVGTFALAMAFAGNDLVNFIGVPLAGFESFKAWSTQAISSPDEFQMTILTGKVGTPTYMLLIAGLVMIITLITSRKARSVVATTLDLSRQNEGEERFQSSLFSRLVVRNTINVNKKFKRLMPGNVNRFLENRFQAIQDFTASNDPDKPAFDKIRASVNLIVASILISLGTSLKLPLSTTYVTFMVAMGTSLSDRAWDRESAVYRISGVFTVISGWFLT
ncbi:MAG: inorganic phosphate transporter, partial [Mariniphaga sp.]|nr:inorganic phosphate transporter [Mariniphaga sp.]